MKNKDRIISSHKNRIENALLSDQQFPDLIGNREAVLLGELQIAQLELEMQNDELSMAVDLLESQRAKFEGFFNLAPTGYFIVNHLGIVEEVNQVGLKLLKIEKEKLVGQRLQSFMLPEDYDLFHELLNHLFPGGDKGTAVIRLANTDGQLLHARFEGIVLSDKFTGKLQFYLTIIDITESRLAELELKDTTKRLELTLSASGIGTWNVNTETGRLFLDTYSLSLLGFNDNEFDGDAKLFFQLVHPDDRPTVKEAMQTAFLETKDIDIEFKLRPKNGSVKVVRLTGLRVEIGDTRVHLAGILADITKTKIIEDTKRQADREKQRIIFEATFSAQEQERERISEALHDSVCQLLYGIRLGLQTIQLNSTVPLNLKNVHQLIIEAIKETRELSYELTPSILRDFGLVAGLKEMISRISTKNFKIGLKIKPTADRLPAQHQLSVFRIVQELLNNCIKHAQASKAEIIVDIIHGEITLTVSDNGIGFQTGETASKQGSGLRAIKNRVFLLNGSVEIGNTSKGAAVTVNIKNE